MYDPKEVWEMEYQLKTIPSSFKKVPSDVLPAFVEFLKKKDITAGKVLDIGCGTGRNSLYLAKLGFEVYGIDISSSALKEFKRLAEENNLQNKVHIILSSVTKRQYLPDIFFDISIDVSTFFHLITEKERLDYLDEISRLLKTGSYLMEVQFLKDDEYYKSMLVDDNIFLDKNNGTKGVLYSKNEIIDFFSKKFEIILTKAIKEKGKMLNKEYKRSRILAILKKR